MMLTLMIYSYVSPSYMKCEQKIKCSINLLESLRFIIHLEKSLFVLTRCIEHLGFVLNSQTMIISLSDVKKEKIKLLCLEILDDECPKVRTIAKLMGKFIIAVFQLHSLASYITGH